MENLKLNLENIKNECDQNKIFKNFVLFTVTFLLMIVAIMSNSIVSAFTFENHDKTKQYNYTYYIEYKSDNSSVSTTSVYRIYYNGDITIDDKYYNQSTHKGFITMTTNSHNDNQPNFYYVFISYKKGTNDIYSGPSIIERSNADVNLFFGDNCGPAYDIKTNDNNLAKSINDLSNGVYIPEYLKTQTPTVKAEQVAEIPQAIQKVMKIVLPLGLAILATFLGIYLIKRLVPLFL